MHLLGAGGIGAGGSNFGAPLTWDEAHAVVAEVASGETVRTAPVGRGGVTLHDEWVVHGSPGNNSPRHRRTYVIAFRARAIHEAERAAGFTHSHNDEVRAFPTASTEDFVS